MEVFEINYLDHVAIRVKDVKASVEWYQKVLGLRPLDVPKWDDYPAFLVSGKAGVAIFPAKLDDPVNDKNSRNTGLSHFAFNVSKEDFEIAQAHFNKLGQEFEFQDHHYSHSIYTEDPDGHTVELTTLVVEKQQFYSSFKTNKAQRAVRSV